MDSPGLKLHRFLTVFRIKRLLRRAGVHPHKAVPGRLLYVPASCSPYHISGYASRTHELLRALREGGVDLLVLTRPGYPWDRPDRVFEPAPGALSTEIDGIVYEHAPSPRNGTPTAVFAARAADVVEAYARQHQVACVHAASNHVNALPALIAARRLGLPFRYEMRGLWELTRIARQPAFAKSRLYTLGLELEGLVAAQADRVYVLSEQLGAYIGERWGIAPERIRLLPNCVDGERVHPDAAVPVQARLVGYAGSLINYEGLDLLLDAVALLRTQGEDLRLWIVGDGEARADLEKQAARLGLQDCVRFWGRVSPEEARACLRECALVCIPRRPFAVCSLVAPIKLVEARALAKAVLVPDLPLFQTEAPDALFFQAGDVQDLARALADALRDPARLASLGQTGRAHALAYRQWRHFLDTLRPD